MKRGRSGYTPIPSMTVPCMELEERLEESTCKQFVRLPLGERGEGIFIFILSFVLS